MRNNRLVWGIFGGVLAIMVLLLAVTLAHSIAFAGQMETLAGLAVAWAVVSDVVIFAFPIFRGYLQAQAMGGRWLLAVLAGFLLLSLTANIATAVAGFYAVGLAAVFRCQVAGAGGEALVPVLYGGSIPLALLALSEAASKLVQELLARLPAAAGAAEVAPGLATLLELSPGQERKVRALLTVYAGNPRARLADLVDGTTITSESAASRARRLAVAAGRLLPVGDMWRPTLTEVPHGSEPPVLP
jgi:hypothetical protein